MGKRQGFQQGYRGRITRISGPPGVTGKLYRGTLLIRKRAPSGPYSRSMSRARWWSLGGGAASCERGTPVALFRVLRNRVFITRIPGGGTDHVPTRLHRFQEVGTHVQMNSVGTNDFTRRRAPLTSVVFHLRIGIDASIRENLFFFRFMAANFSTQML